LAVLATLSRSRTEQLLADGADLPAALTDGYHLAFGIGAALVLVAIVLATTVLRSEGARHRNGVIEDEFSPTDVSDSWAA
jgi:hypothetical protein